MPSVKTSQPCVICLVNEPVMHSHHTVPQARGGKNSRQIILCSGCHNILHAHALYMVSLVRNPKREKKYRPFWKTEREELNAKPWLEILVASFLLPLEESDSVERKVMATLSVADFNLFKILAAEYGSQEKALQYCIRSTLAQKGIRCEQTQPELWWKKR